MKKRTKILLLILILFGLPIGGIICWQRQNIQALLEASRYSKEELATQIDEQKAQVESVLNEYGLEGLNDLTFAQEEAIRKGELSLEEVQEQLEQNKIASKKEALLTPSSSAPSSTPSSTVDSSTIDSTATPPSSKTHNPSTPSVVSPQQNNNMDRDNADRSQEIVRDVISRLYALKAEYIGRLGGLESAAKGEYFALPSNERRGSSAKKLLTKYMSLGLAAESECDARVAALLSQLKQDLEAINASTSIVSTLQSSYEQEKTLKKAYYLSLVQ